MSNLSNNTTSLQEILEALQNKAVGGSSNLELYGTYILRDIPDFTRPDDYVFFDFSVVDAFAFFYNGEDYEYRYITDISFGDDGLVYITSDGGDFCTTYDGYNWVADGIGEFPDSRYKIIDVKVPLSVTQDSYDLFMGIVDCNTEETPYAVGESVGMVIGESAGMGAGIEIGRQQQYDEFWDNFQNYGNRTRYNQAFRESGFEYIRPKYKIIPTVSQGAGAIFQNCASLKKVEAEYFDFSQYPYGTGESSALYYIFSGCSSLEEIEDVGLSPSYVYCYTFAYCRTLHTIAKMRVDGNTRYNNTFNNCAGLINLTVEGTIGQNGLDLHWSTKLSKASIASVINALSTTTSGLSITLSKTAVDTAFPPSGVLNTNIEWTQLINTRSNWTINLV